MPSRRAERLRRGLRSEVSGASTKVRRSRRYSTVAVQMLHLFQPETERLYRGDPVLGVIFDGAVRNQALSHSLVANNFPSWNSLPPPMKIEPSFITVRF